ncbi:MAG: hypothetical protein C5B51_24995 [Terriglobia bacterium]|nr:MAG: hypothetical protein C5B51_24995 [Terriglobia bacterium]
MKLSLRVVPVLAVTLVPWLLVAQQGEKLIATMAENARVLHQYTFKQRSDIKYKGEDKVIITVQVRFDQDGKRQVMPISQTGGQEATGLGRRIINRKRAEMKEYVDRVAALVESYLPPEPEKLRSALLKAEIGQAGSLMSLTMKNYFKAGDSLALTVDPATRRLSRIELKTDLDKDPISVTAELTPLAGAGNVSYPGLTKIKVPVKNLEIDISQYDYMKL